MKLNSFGLYLYGSYARSQTHAGSDVDLFLIGFPHQSQKVIQLFREWSQTHLPQAANAKVDMWGVEPIQYRPKYSSVVSVLAELDIFDRKPILGIDLKSYCFKPQANDLLEAEKHRLIYWHKMILSKSFSENIEFICLNNTTKSFYNMLLSFKIFDLYSKNRNYKIYLPQDIQDPLFQKCELILKRKHSYQMPKLQSEQLEVIQLLEDIYFACQARYEALTGSKAA